MKPFITCLSLLLLGCCTLVLHANENTQLLLGTGKVDITPPIGEPMGGYAERAFDVSTSIHDKVYARAVSFSFQESDAHQTQSKTGVLINADLILIPQLLKQAVEKTLQEKLKQQHNQQHKQHIDWLSISASHTHYSVGGYMDNKVAELAVAGPYDEAIFNRLVEQLSNAALQSLQNPQAVSMAYLKSEAPVVNQNRRHKHGPRDTELRSIAFKNAKEQIIAVLLNHGVHSTLMPHSSTAISGDIAGVTASKVEEKFPQAVALFLNAGLGDQGPKEVEAQTFQAVNEIAESLAESVKTQVEHMQFENVSKLRFMQQRLSMPETRLRWAIECWAGLNQLFPILGPNMFPESSELMALQINQQLLLFSPAEIALGVQQQLEQHFHNYSLMTVALANDYWGYVLTPEDYATGGYETCMNYYGPDFSNTLLQHFDALVTQ